jgi:hypothetical protein
LTGVPDHDTTKGGVALLDDEVDNVADCGRWYIAISSRAATEGSNEDLDVGVHRDSFGPCLPGVEVKVILGGGTNCEVDKTAVIVVELNPNSVKVDSAIKHRAIGFIWVDTLRSGSQVVGLGGISVVKGAQLIGISGHVAHFKVLKVKVEAVNNCGTKGTKDGAVVGNWPEDFPHEVGEFGCFILAGKSTFGVCTTSGR